MKAKKKNLYEEIIKPSNIQYHIPVYQRTYDWKKKHCNQLYNDILESIKKQNKHYLGCLVYSKKKYNNFTQCQIIDGQQRITTVTLLLKAIYDSIPNEKNNIKDSIYNSLYNENCEERYKLKLKTIDNDDDNFTKILTNQFDAVDEMSNISINYENFKERIQESLNEGYTIKQIFSGIKNLEIVEIILSSEDEPQKIFESINSKGIELTTAALIRNYLLMGIIDVGKQKEKYNKYWKALEILLTKENIEKFFYDFLIMKDNRYMNEKETYENFQKYYRSIDNKDLIFEEILKYAYYYQLIVCNNSNKYSKETNELCKIFNIINHNTIYSFLLKICNDYDDITKLYDKKINLSEDEEKSLKKKETEFNKIISLFGNYAIRRSISGIPSSSLRRFYSNLYEKIFKKEENKNKYYLSIKSYLCRIATDDKFPTDEMFINGLYYNNVYKKSPLLRHFFEIIENDAKEKVSLTGLTIEHIMPKTLTREWMEELGENYLEIHNKYKNTLGNLSITGYNSEYSNDTFEEKRQQFLEKLKENKTKIITLNKEYLDKNIKTWGATEIENRAKRLMETILKKYSYPKKIDYDIEYDIYTELLLTQDLEDIVIDDSWHIFGFKFNNEKILVKNYKELYKELQQILYKKNPTILNKLAKSKFKFSTGKRIDLSTDIFDIRQSPKEFVKGIYSETNFDKYYYLVIFKKLLELYEIDLQNFSILYIETINKEYRNEFI